MLEYNDFYLRRLSEEDAATTRAWRFENKNYDCFYEYVPISVSQNHDWILNSLKKENELNFIFENHSERKPLGTISLIDIDNRNKKCEMGRVLIGGGDYRGKGLGLIMVSLLLEYAFNHLNMHKIYCEVFTENQRAVSFYKKIGFEQDGLFLSHIYKNGNYKDIAHLSLFKQNWKKSV